MAIYFTWYGGSSYGTPTIESDLEMVGTLTMAATILEDRYNGSSWAYPVSEDPAEFVDFPAVDDTTEMQVWTSNPRGRQDTYPDMLMRIHRDAHGDIEVITQSA